MFILPYFSNQRCKKTFNNYSIISLSEFKHAVVIELEIMKNKNDILDLEKQELIVNLKVHFNHFIVHYKNT